MWALGQIVVYHGLAVDKPIFTWMIHHQVHALAALMNRLTKIGNTWTCWGAAFAAAVCLAATWRTKKWLPPSVLAGLIVIDHFTTLALRHVFHPLWPPADQPARHLSVRRVRPGDRVLRPDRLPALA